MYVPVIARLYDIDMVQKLILLSTNTAMICKQIVQKYYSPY